jgi:hypothetical protein
VVGYAEHAPRESYAVQPTFFWVRFKASAVQEIVVAIDRLSSQQAAGRNQFVAALLAVEHALFDWVGDAWRLYHSAGRKGRGQGLNRRKKRTASGFG